MTVFLQFWENGVNWLLNWWSATILLGWCLAREGRLQVVWSEFDSKKNRKKSEKKIGIFGIFWNFLEFLGIFWNFLGSFWIYFESFWIFRIFRIFLDFSGIIRKFLEYSWIWCLLWVVALADPAAVEGGAAEALESVQVLDVDRLGSGVALDVANGVSGMGGVHPAVDIDIMANVKVAVQLFAVVVLWKGHFSWFRNHSEFFGIIWKLLKNLSKKGSIEKSL